MPLASSSDVCGCVGLNPKSLKGRPNGDWRHVAEIYVLSDYSVILLSDTWSTRKVNYRKSHGAVVKSDEVRNEKPRWTPSLAHTHISQSGLLVHACRQFVFPCMKHSCQHRHLEVGERWARRHVVLV